MEWKKTLAATAVLASLSPAAWAQFVDLDDVTVDLDAVTQPLERRVETVEKPAPITRPQTEEGVPPRTVFLYVIPAEALADGVITADEIEPDQLIDAIGQQAGSLPTAGQR